MTAEHALSIYKKLRNCYGEVRPGLNYSGIYELTVAVVLSAQTTDRQVNVITPSLFSNYPDFNSLSTAKRTDVESIIRSVGFFRTKAANIIRLSEEICNRFNGNVPDTIEKLISLPGIGRKSANVILAQGHGIPGLAVDTHVMRISHRLEFTSEKTPDRIEIDLKKLFPEKIWSDVHLTLIHHGRTTCFARKPECAGCPVFNECNSKDKNF